MNQDDKDLIKQTLLTKGWKHIEAMLEEEANAIKKIETDGKDYRNIAVECIANDKISKILKSLLRKLNTIKGGEVKTPTVYK